MKIKITIKNPDSIYDSISRAAESSVENKEDIYQSLVKEKHEEIEEICSKWIEYGEYVTIEIDTELGTARVCEAK